MVLVATWRVVLDSTKDPLPPNERSISPLSLAIGSPKGHDSRWTQEGSPRVCQGP